MTTPDGPQPGFLRRFGWFALIWVASTTVVMGGAELIHMMIPR
ncbi:DUF2474 domain-containing protein [Acetobacter estunensis]|uniref:DUF2474 domain-containing protein n=1 Tax=Acetobacter estunensis TaxID=104097 RepID=A0A967B3Y7_9PROT|nr:DUF2474 domain-containing protein [Acetobacter estunensis]NHO52468.1 DUF2474 domain-containing protein [Acetobacter estunensis]